MNEDFLLPAYQKLYAALNSLERFSKGQDLFDNIACIDSFWLNFVMLHLFCKIISTYGLCICV